MDVDWKKQLQEGTLNPFLSQLYAVRQSEVAPYAARLLHVIDSFENRFGHKDGIRLFSAPGRTELGGNHTDHQLGHVLAASVNLDIVAAVRPTEDETICICSEGYPEITVFLQENKKISEEENTTTALVRGVMAAFQDKGYPIRGFQGYFTSDVLKGSGLSSSAAFEVILGVIFNSLFCQEQETPQQIAQIGQFAENVYFGKPSGLMDQMASSVGGFISIDFKDQEHPMVKKIDFPFSDSGYKLCIVDTGGNHADLTPEYAAVPSEMNWIASQFGKEVLSQVDQKEFYDRLPELHKLGNDRAILRGVHFFEDDQRAQEEATALEENDFSRFLHIAKESGESSYMQLQNLYASSAPKEQGLCLALYLCKKVLGNLGAYRVHGGGFAGTVQAFVPEEKLELFQAEMERVFGKGKCYILSVRPYGGIEIKG